jgi:hypothetical protein
VAFLSKRKHPTETRLAGWGGNSHGWGIIRGFSTTWLDMKALDTVNCTVIFCCQTEARNRDTADASTSNLRTLAVGSAIASYPSHLIVGGRRRTSARPNCGSLCLRVSVQRALARIAECAEIRFYAVQMPLLAGRKLDLIVPVGARRAWTSRLCFRINTWPWWVSPFTDQKSLQRTSATKSAQSGRAGR